MHATWKYLRKQIIQCLIGVIFLREACERDLKKMLDSLNDWMKICSIKLWKLTKQHTIVGTGGHWIFGGAVRETGKSLLIEVVHRIEEIIFVIIERNITHGLMFSDMETAIMSQ